MRRLIGPFYILDKDQLDWVSCTDNHCLVLDEFGREYRFEKLPYVNIWIRRKDKW